MVPFSRRLNCFLVFTVFIKIFIFNYVWISSIKSKEFLIEFKDLNISYFYYGYGEHSCYGNSLLIATMSRPNASDLRMGVRNSWKRDIPSNISHKFFIGWTWNITLRETLNEESQKFGDIVFTNIVDAYSNLTLKMTAIYQWQQFFCPNVYYLLRADEDTVLDVSRLQYWLNKEFNVISKNLNEMVIFGHVFERAPVQRDPNNKWYVPYDVYNQTYYPDFVNGPCYLITSKAIQRILKEAKNHKYMVNDDALQTGIIAKELGIYVTDSRKFIAYGNPLNQSHHECDENGTPFLFNIFDEAGEIETVQNGYDIALKKLKELNCSTSSILKALK